MRKHIIAGIIYSVIAALIIAVAGYFIPSVATALDWMTHLWGVSWSHLNSSFAIPRWLVYLLIALILYRVGSRLRKFIASVGTEEHYQPNYTSYYTDTFEGVVWRWSYAFSQSRVEVRELAAFCPVCDGDLVEAGDGFYFTLLNCEHCNRNRLEYRGGGYLALVSKLEREIVRRIRTGEWKAKVKTSGENLKQV